ncbi:hypothetical protein [uncultured Clostridium sp.]|nr:hypothetical protein [uncultured Clostridium sp.]
MKLRIQLEEAVSIMTEAKPPTGCNVLIDIKSGTSKLNKGDKVDVILI